MFPKIELQPASTALALSGVVGLSTYLHESTLHILCESEEEAWEVNQRQESIAIAVGQLHRAGILRVAPTTLEISSVEKGTLYLCSLQKIASEGLTVEIRSPNLLAIFLRDTDQDRFLLAEMLESGQTQYLVDMETDVCRLGTTDITLPGDRTAIRLSVENNIRPYWDLQKLADFKQRVFNLATVGGDWVEIDWQARGTAEGQMSAQEFQNYGQVRLLTFRGRLHRLVWVQRTEPINSI